MFLPEKEISIWEAHQTKNPPVGPWKYAETGGTLLGDLLCSSQLGVCKINACSNYSQRASHQFSSFSSGLHSG